MTLEQEYARKSEAYFDRPRHDIVAMLNTDSGSAVLELGCGTGSTGAAVLAAGKAGRYTGIELSASAAAIARTRIPEVLQVDVEALDVADRAGTYDALIISEVLEHLVDPWSAARKLATCLKPGGQFFASSPNVAHWRVLRSLVRGRFEYEDEGVMDRTHLRWFTPASYRALAEAAGIEIVSVEPTTPPAPRVRFINRITGGRFGHLFYEQIMLSGRKA